IARDHDDRSALRGALLEQRVRLLAGDARQLADDAHERRRIRPRRDDRVLRAAELRRSDELHCTRDLARVLDALDALADGLQRRHYFSFLSIENCFANSVSASRSRFSRSPLNSPTLLSSVRMSCLRAFMNDSSSFS